MNIKRNQSNFTFLLTNSYKPDQTKSCLFELSVDEVMEFEGIFNGFIDDMHEDDEKYEDADELFVENGYLYLETVIEQNEADYLKEVLNRFMFEDFFECYLETKGENVVVQIQQC